jgi:hypothetical protein
MLALAPLTTTTRPMESSTPNDSSISLCAALNCIQSPPKALGCSASVDERTRFDRRSHSAAAIEFQLIGTPEMRRQSPRFRRERVCLILPESAHSLG